MTLRHALKRYPGLWLFFKGKSSRQRRNNRVAVLVSLVMIAVCLAWMIPEMQRKGGASAEGLSIMLGVTLLLVLGYAVPVLGTRCWRQTRWITGLTGEQWERIQEQVSDTPPFGSCTLTQDAVLGYSRFVYRLVGEEAAKRVMLGFLGDTDRQVIPLALVENARLRRMEGCMDFLQLTMKPGYPKHALLPLERLLSDEERKQMRGFFDKHGVRAHTWGQPLLPA